MREWCGSWQVEVWAYCLMPNHVHLIAVPPSEEGLRQAMGDAHRRYTRRVNFREGWRGHLWQGRFASYPLEGPYLRAAARDIEQNPVRAGLAVRPWEYPWSSAAAHMRRAQPGGAAPGVGGPWDGLSRHGSPCGRDQGTPPP